MRYFIFIVMLVSSQGLYAGVLTTKHNLSISGVGTVKAATEDKVCIFCHVAHQAAPQGPLWNRRSTGAIYTPYSSSTAKAIFGQPTGSSLLCLSCHDGTIALGDVLNGGPITMLNGVTTMPLTANGSLGTNLSDDHPFSFVFDSALAAQRGELVNPSTLTGPVKLDATGQLQCVTCHDPHNDVFGKFLVMDNRGTALCETCHQKVDWAGSPHNNSNSTWNGVPPDPWPNSIYTTVADNGCENCHKPHSAGLGQRLLNQITEEDTCTICHNGNVTSNVLIDFNKISVHPIMNTVGIHDPTEPVIVTTRHVECVDCHNPHSAGTGPGTPGINGVDFLGNIVTPITQDYQLCFRCHGDSPNRAPPRSPRQVLQANIRLQFDIANPSFHPVAGVGKNADVPSLIPPLTTASLITCTDCHGGDGGNNKPHGSIYAPILKLQNMTTPVAESPAAYALCYSCHDRNSILGDVTFSEHNKHIVGENAPCNTCHDPHGVSIAAGATITNNVKLINFNTNFVTPSGGIMAFTSTGPRSGSCTLICHGENHNPETYGGGGGIVAPVPVGGTAPGATTPGATTAAPVVTDGGG